MRCGVAEEALLELTKTAKTWKGTGKGTWYKVMERYMENCNTAQ